jgi:CPA1 family monovalent cation:H+ antiporter
MEVARQLIAIVAAVVAVSALARRLGRSAPPLLVLAGFALSYLPNVHDVRIEPDVILIGLLPPLLYAASIRTSLIDFRANARPIALLSVGLVAFTMLGVGLVAWWMLPITFPAALALGAVVAPPDAVAATAVARRVGMPRRIVSILEGESLVNDATAIVCLRSAVAAITGSVTALEVTGNLLRSVVGGLAVGVVAAILFAKVRKHVTDVVTDTTISLVCPFAVYIAAEEVHASGVLAVVVAGLLLGHKSQVIQSAPSRVMERGNWATVQFVLENSVFFLIGLQARTILRDLGNSDLSTGRIVAAAAAVLLAVIVLRFIWVFPATYLPRWLVPAINRRDPSPPWTTPTVIGWAGMRGAVTLAAVFVLPEETPHREVLVMIALVVAAGTLLIQGSTLPLLVRSLGLRGPDPAQDVLTEARVQQQSASAGLAELDSLLTGDEPPEVVARLRQRGLDRANTAWEQLGGSQETPTQIYARLRTQMLEAERAEVLRARDNGEAPDEVLRRVLDSLDIEETVLIRASGTDSSERETDLVPHAKSDAPCDHLAEAASQHPVPNTPQGCEECLAIGQRWVHLRLCMECGHVGCCDSSIGKHATAHFHAIGHPVMRSLEPGEAWRWCFVDEVVG